MMIVPRDIKIMRWIHGHGFVVTRQVVEFMGVGKSAGSLRVKKLSDAGYLERQRIFHGQPRVLTLTKKGVDLIDDGLGEMRNMRCP
jgi:DNA-binding MarR family transcriptional regulator